MNCVLDGFAVDISARVIDVGDQSKRLTPKATAVLHELIKADGQVVTRDALLDAVWPDLHVVDEVLTQAIAELRRALGESARTPRYIETVAKRGYRLLVQPHRPPVSTSIPAALRADGRQDAATPEALTFAPSLVVIPFDVLAGGQHAEALANGLSRDLGTSLARARWLSVSAQASALALSDVHAEPLDIARALGVRYALWGSVIESDGRLRIMISLCDSESSSVIWAERYDRPMQDLFDVLEDVGQVVALTVEAEIDRHLRQIARIAPLETLDAWGLYHRAAKHRVVSDPREIAETGELLTRAGKLAPHSARIRSARALLELRRHVFASSRGDTASLEHATNLAREAIALDSCEPEAMVVLGRALGLSGQQQTALDWLRRGVRANPSSFSARVFCSLAMLVAGEHREAIDQINQAERLSPFDPVAYALHATRAQALALGGDPDAALTHSERAALHPNANEQISAVAAWCAAAAGRTDIARRHAQRLLQAWPSFAADDFFSWFRFDGQDRKTIKCALVEAGL